MVRGTTKMSISLKLKNMVSLLLFFETKDLLIQKNFGITFKRISPFSYRSKGLFWLASRPKQALIWGQAGGSLKADSAGVWWSSMPFKNRIQQIAFIENQDEIEKNWDKTYGDRKNEIVFIGQNMNEDLIRSHLEKLFIKRR